MTIEEKYEQLKEDYYYDQQLINDIIQWQEEFIEYLDKKIEQDKINKKIYEEIKKEFEKMLI